MSEWKPIETADIKPFSPEDWLKSGTPSLLLTNGYRAAVGSYSYTFRGKGRWLADGQIFIPTHWMAIPALPPPEAKP